MNQFNNLSKMSQCPYLIPSYVDADLAEGGDAVAALGLGRRLPARLVLLGRSLGFVVGYTCG